jgi:iron complex outermembrane receptor protein
MLLSVFAANQLYRKRVWQPALVTCHRAPIMMKYLSRASILPMFLMISALPGQGAESVADLSEQDFLADVPVVLTASRLRQNVADAPAAVTVIDRQMIRDSGAWSIPDLFRLVPGMYVGEGADKGALVPNTMVSYHGLSDSFSRRMQVLVDGRSIYTPLFGGAVWSTLPLALEDIERIEVIRGPNSATYGANAFLGIINIISRQAADVSGTMVSLTQSSRGNDSTFRYGGQSGSLDYRITGSLRADQGIELQAPTAPGHSFSARRHDDKRLANLSFRGDLQLGNRDSLEIQAGLSSGDHQSGRRESPGAYEGSPPHTRQLNSYYGSLRWQRTLSADEQLSLKAYASRDEQNLDLSALLRDPKVTIAGLPFYLEVPYPLNSPQRLVAERYDVELQHAFAPTSSTRLVWGGGARLDRFSSTYYLNSTEPVEFRQQNLFANLEWRPTAKWVLNAGGMLERNSFTGTYWSPRVAANYHWQPGHTLRLIASRATHTPTIFEAKSDIRLSTSWTPASCATLKAFGLITSCAFPSVRSAYHQDDLRSETIDSRELGYLWELPGGHLDFKYSYDRLGDLLETYRPAGKSWQEYRNEGNAQIRAVEMQWQQRVASNTRIHLALAASRISGFNSERSGAYAESAASHSRSMLLAHDFDHRWTGSLAYYAVGRLTVQGDGDLQTPYERVDARLAYRFRDGAYQGEVAFIVQNLFDKPYQEVYYENLIGRRSYVNLRLEF